MHTAMGGSESYIPFVAVDAGSANTVYIPSSRKKWSRAFVAGGSALALTAIVCWVTMSGTEKYSGPRSLLTSILDETDDRINKINEGMGGVYYNVFTGKPVHGSSTCTAGSYLRKNEEGHHSCVDCPVGQVNSRQSKVFPMVLTGPLLTVNNLQWCDYDVQNPCPDKSTSHYGAESVSQCYCKPGIY